MDTSKRILLIEDDMDDQSFFKWAVAAIDPNAEIISAKNGADGIQKLMKMEVPPNWVFLDLNMPLMNGFDCFMQIREKKLVLGVPLIIFSTSNNEKDIAKAKELGAAGYLKKPNDNNSLVKALGEIFSKDFSKPNNKFVFK